MKKLFLLLISVFAIISFAMAQNVPRQMVAIEDATGTWCPYCPGAAMGCDDLLSNGKFVAVIANHNSDGFANVYSNTRNTMYNVQAFPSAGFDATLGYVGGSHTQSNYNSYLPYYNQLIAVTSPVEISMVVSKQDLTYTAVVTLNKVGTITSVNNILYFFVTQSHIQQSWQGQTHLEHVNRLMVPDQNGTLIDFSSGNTQTVTLTFDMSSNWPLEDCEFITFLQNKDAGQGNQGGYNAGYPLKKFVVYQTIKRGVIDLTPEFTASETSILINQPVTFTNATTGGYIGVPETYQWLFPGATPDTSTEKNPTISYADSGAYDVTLIVNRGGQIDTLTKTAYIHSSYPVGIQEKSSGMSASIFPNPNDGKFVLELNSLKAITTDLKIMNTLGSTIYEESDLTINGKVVKSLNLDLNSGIYFVVLQNGDKKVIHKLFVN